MCGFDTILGNNIFIFNENFVEFNLMINLTKKMIVF